MSMNAKRSATSVFAVLVFLMPGLLLGSGIFFANKAVQEERSAVARAEALIREVEEAGGKKQIAAVFLTSLFFAVPISISALKEVEAAKQRPGSAPASRRTVTPSGILARSQRGP